MTAHDCSCIVAPKKPVQNHMACYPVSWAFSGQATLARSRGFDPKAQDRGRDPCLSLVLGLCPYLIVSCHLLLQPGKCMVLHFGPCWPTFAQLYPVNSKMAQFASKWAVGPGWLGMFKWTCPAYHVMALIGSPSLSSLQTTNCQVAFSIISCTQSLGLECKGCKEPICHLKYLKVP
jgi:hypothetical protein